MSTDTAKKIWQVIDHNLKKLHFSPDMRSIDLREINNWLIKESPMAHIFRALGLTLAQQMNRAFSMHPSIKFIETIHKLYYLFCLRAYDEKLDYLPVVSCPSSLWTLGREGWDTVMEEVNRKWRQARSAAYRAESKALGRGEYREQSESRVIAIQKTDEATFYKWLNYIPETYYIPCALRLWREVGSRREAEEFLNSNEDEIRGQLIKSYGYRKILEEYILQGEIQEAEVGISLQELNRLGEEYAAKLERVFKASVTWELVSMDLSDEMVQREQESYNHRKRICMEEVGEIGKANVSAFPQEIQGLIERLGKIHHYISCSIESGGIHIYIPDPDLLAIGEEKELYSRHLAINAEKYYGIGKWNVENYPTQENRELYRKYRQWGREVPCAMSMKTRKRYKVYDLLNMPPLQDRIKVRALTIPTVIVGGSNLNKHLVYDDNGNLVPEKPGECIPLTSLNKTHPACRYLRSRGFDPVRLSAQYNITYCTQALPEDRSVGRYYSKLPGGMKNSPQGRIIIPVIDIAGVQRGWQARAIMVKDKKEEDWFLNDLEEWVQVTQDGEDLFTSDRYPKGLGGSIRKYLNATGMARNESLFGIYQAWQLMKDTPFTERVVYLMEGALDVCKGGPPCVALLGKNMSRAQADVILAHFGRVVLICDRDAAGREMRQNVASVLRDIDVIVGELPEGKKDLGECSYGEAAECLHDAVKNR